MIPKINSRPTVWESLLQLTVHVDGDGGGGDGDRCSGGLAGEHRMGVGAGQGVDDEGVGDDGVAAARRSARCAAEGIVDDGLRQPPRHFGLGATCGGEEEGKGGVICR